ncbi:MAG: DEAD/DEAH box helicase family protein [Gemmatimonadaceae bacterium]
MKVTLKDYQDDAVREILASVRKARKRWREESERHAFSLTAPTGAGKTVMAAAVFEALFHGDDDYDFDADPGAVVIWFSDDPSLNEQTRFRLMASADRLRSTDMVVVDNSFHRQRFEPGKIYFLNTQKLGKNSRLVRGFDQSEEDQHGFPQMRADMRAHTIWDTIRNTIEDPSLTLYLVLDEAHRGMGKPSRAAEIEKSTLVKRLINGEKGVPGVPVVLGISATVERFNRAMEGAMGRTTLPGVQVDAARVQDSGLLKDTIVVDIPDEEGQFDTVLVRLATDKLRESATEWAKYGKEQESGESVVPLMVLQVPNTPNPNEVGQWLDTIFQRWSDLPEDCIAHVFGEHTTQTFGRHTVPYISPERVQDATWVRVLLAKDAISTGWDCPRAEVMVSFRPAKDPTHITQLLGRMVRTPLARRIPGNDRLNSVDCLLPFFDEKAVKDVVDALMQGGGDVPPLGRILINPVEMKPNPAVTAVIWDVFTSLPSQTRPQHGARPPKRLTALAHELAMDALLPKAGQKAHAAMHKALDAFIAKNPYEFKSKRESVKTVEGRTIVLHVKAQVTEFRSFQTEADAVVINDAYRRTARIISPDIARTYTEHRARQKPEKEYDFDDALIEAREDIGALGLMQNLDVYIDAEATKLAEEWLRKYREQIKELPDDRQEAYREIRALSREPQDVDLARPVSRWELTAAREKDGSETKLQAYENHVLCDGQGAYPAELNEWERAVLRAEMKRDGFRFWYRNPGRPTQDSLGVAYMDGDDTKTLRPDFLFFAEDSKGRIVVDIVDPHSVAWADALAKLQGLARYAATHPDAFRRVEAVAEVKGKLRVLDLTRVDVRKAIEEALEARALYEGALAKNYPDETPSGTL